MSAWDSRANAIFLDALERAAADERGAYLDGACGADAELRARVEALLAASEQAGSFLNQPAVAVVGPDDGASSADTDLPAEPGTRIGPYRLVKKLGEGGMGVVWVAEQTEPVRRGVALKLIKPGLDSRQVLHRFEQERQALALMDHTNIAKVLDADSDAGRPYFVMELVQGVPITQYCDAQRLTVRERLGLVVPVCQAIQHAHQKGVIHRDIKPSNVLVAVQDGRPVPKVIDFGVAKALHQPLAERDTAVGQVVGTLEYMSPEQAELSALDIDTRADVYALGVLLYELLTGTTPLGQQRSPDTPLWQALRLIREQEPPKPSTLLRNEPTSRFGSFLSSFILHPSSFQELDWIVMKCLEKDRGRRYESAGGLARDVERYLRDEPVEAGPPSAAYRLKKFARRYRTGLATAAAFVLLLVVGTVVSASLAVWAMREQSLAHQRLGEATSQKERAERAETQVREQLAAVQQQKERAEKAEKEAKGNEAKARQEQALAKEAEANIQAVLAFFRNRVLSAGRPLGFPGGLGKDVTLRKAVDAAEPAIAQSFAHRPWAEALIRDTLGTTYWYLGEVKLAIPQYERALALFTAKLGADDPVTLTARNNLANAFLDDARIADALRIHRQNVTVAEQKLGTDHPETLAFRNGLAGAYERAGHLKEAIRLHEKNLPLMETKFGTDDRRVLIARNNLASAYDQAGRTDEAIRLHEQTLKQRQAKLGAHHPATLRSRYNLAAAYQSAGRTAEAIALLEQTLNQCTARLGAGHPDTVVARNNLATAYQSAGRIAEAISLWEENLRQRQAAFGPDHPYTYVACHLVANAYCAAGRTAEAETLFRSLLERLRQRFGSDDPRATLPMADLGRSLLLQDKYVDAEAVLRDGLRIRAKKLPDDWGTFHTQSLLGEALLRQKKYADAEPLLLQGYQGMKQRAAKIPLPDKPRLTEALGRLVRLYEATGDKDKADAWRRQWEQAKAAPGTTKKGPVSGGR